MSKSSSSAESTKVKDSFTDRSVNGTIKFVIDENIPEPILSQIKGSEDSVTMHISHSTIQLYIVKSNITAKDLEDYKGDLRIIYQDYKVPLLVLNYKYRDFHIPIIATYRGYIYTNKLSIFFIEKNDYTLKYIDNICLTEHMSAKIIGSKYISNDKKLFEEGINIAINDAFPKYSVEDVLQGGLSQTYKRLNYSDFFNDIEEALVEKYQDSEQCEANDLKQAEKQSEQDTETRNNEAISHPDYPKDYS